MIATTRGLAILAAIAVALFAASFIPGERSQAAVDRSLLPGFDETSIAEVGIFWGELSMRVRRSGSEWRIDEMNAAANPAAIDAMFTALRAGRWHRRVPRSQVVDEKRPHGTPSLKIGNTSLAIGPPLAGSDQTWIFRGDDALLVDNWVARALVPALDELAQSHPLDCSTNVLAHIDGRTVRIVGNQLVEPTPMWLDEAWRRAVTEACAAIEYGALDGTPDGSSGVHVIANGELKQIGRCGDSSQVFVEAPIGNGCVAATALKALTDTLATPQPDLRPLPIEPAKLTLQDGVVVDVTAKRVADSEADADRVRDLISALMTRGTAKPRPAGNARATITAVDKAGTEVVLELYKQQIARRGEPVAIDIAPDAWATITRPSSALRDATRWREDPTTISALTLDNVTYKRGAVLGEWTREPAGTVEPALVDALVESIATLRAPSAPPPPSIAHRMRITITPPAGAPVTHALEIGPPSEQGCAARVDRAPMMLPLPACTAIVALAAQQK